MKEAPKKHSSLSTQGPVSEPANARFALSGAPGLGGGEKESRT